MEKLEKEKARCHMLQACNTKEEAECVVLTHKLEAKESLIATLQEKNENLIWENGKIKETVSSLGADLKQSERKLRELQEVEVELMTQIGEKNRELEDLKVQVESMNVQLTSEINAANQEKDEMLEELVIAQQNISELVGATRERVVVDNLVCAETNIVGGAMDHETPPTLPAPREDLVDKAVYEALQQAYENVEQYHYKATEDNKGLIAGLQILKSKHDAAVLKNAEYVHRIEQCRQEYKTKVMEVMELQRKVDVGGMAGNKMEVHDELTSLRAKLRDMEENQEQVGKSWEEAIKELTSRKEELKQKSIKLAEMENTVVTLQEELHLLKTEYEDFQDRHDKINHDKIAKIDEQQHFMDKTVLELTELRSMVTGLQKEKAKQENTVKMLRTQLETLKASVKTTEERTCPICNTRFPKRISQQDFEQHVQGHFPGTH